MNPHESSTQAVLACPSQFALLFSYCCLLFAVALLCSFGRGLGVVWVARTCAISGLSVWAAASPRVLSRGQKVGPWTFVPATVRLLFYNICTPLRLPPERGPGARYDAIGT